MNSDDERHAMETHQERAESREDDIFGHENTRPSCLTSAVLLVALLVFMFAAWSGSFALCRYYAPSWVGSVAGFILWILALKIGFAGAAIALFFQIGLRAFSLVWRACRRMIGLDRHKARDRALLDINIWGAVIGFVVAIFALCAATAGIFSLVGNSAPGVSIIEMALALGGYHVLISLILVAWQQVLNGAQND